MTREEREEAIEYIKRYRKLDEDLHNIAPKGTVSSFATERCLKYWDMAIKALEQEPCEDAISRQAVNDLVDELARAISDERLYIPQRGRSTGTILQDILDLPPVTPQPKTGRCKSCRWWKDSDGVYRRGVGAESICPINCEEVLEGEGYCFRYEPKMQEVEK